MLSLLSLHLPPHLRSPRNVAAAIAVAAVAGIAWYALKRPRQSAEELERERRELLASIGRITDGSITDAPSQPDEQAGSNSEPLIIVYNYRIAGVTYECAQDVSSLAEHVRDVRADLPIQVRYDLHNPGNSIVVAESWSGLRLSPHPHDHEMP